MCLYRWFVFFGLTLVSAFALAESYGTAFTYQGQLQYQGSAAHGEFDFTFTLFDIELDGIQVTTPIQWEDVQVNEGTFTVELDFGTLIQSTDEYWLEIAVRPGYSTGDYTLLSPRQYLYPNPRSVFALRADTAGQSAQAGDSDMLQGHPASDFALSTHDHGELSWRLSGNVGTITGQFLGTVDNQALELRVNNSRALRVEPDTTSPNIIGGYSSNTVTGANGATINGGGRDLAINQVSGDFGAVGGGAGNTVSGYAATVGGGEQHSAMGSYAAIGGGQQNSAGDHAVVGGGESNQATGSHATVAGGSTNDASAAFTSIGGGTTNQAAGNFAAVGGGSYNDAQAKYAAIVGGGPSDEGNPSTSNNRVSDNYGAIGGGGGNSAGDGDGDVTSAPFTTVGGGRQNSAAGSYAAVGGGNSNTAGGYASAISGGDTNSATGSYATVSGGSSNSAGSQYATVSGGRNNNASNAYATVGGGFGNTASGPFATVPGGQGNTASGQGSFSAGIQASANHDGSFVWSDSNTDPFSSTADNQFLVRAAGGVGIGTDSPSGALQVVGNTRFQGNARVLGRDDLVLQGRKSILDPDCLGIPEEDEKNCLQKPTSIVVVGNTAFTVSNAYNTLTAFNVKNPRQIRVLSMSTNSLHKPIQVVISGSRAYVVNDSDGYKLAVFDISGSTMRLIGSMFGTELPGRPLDVFVAGTFAYLVGSQPTPFFAIVDVSDATEMVLRGSTSTGGRSIHVEGNLAFVADPDGNRLAVYDVSEPETPVLIGSSSDQVANPSSIYVSGKRAFVTMEGSNALVVYDLTSPDSPAFMGSITGSFNRPVSVVVLGDYAFVACEGQPDTADNSGVIVFDVSDPSAIEQMGSTGLAGMNATSVFVSGNRVFVTTRCRSGECSDHIPGDDGFLVYEFNHLGSPTLQAGALQASSLDVTDSVSIANGLSVGGGFNAGRAHVDGDLGIGGDLRMLGSIGGEDDFACTEQAGLDECISWTTRPALTFTNDIFLGGHWIRGALSGHCSEGYAILDPDEVEPTYCCGFVDDTSISHCLPDVTYISGQKVAVDGHLVPACDAEDVGCNNSNGWDLGHPLLRWDEVWAANGVIQTSDGRMKDNVAPLNYGMADLARLQPVSFAWQDGDPDTRHLGLIAQDVLEVMPELVRGGDDAGGGALGLNYAELVPVLINAVKELSNEVSDQASTIETLQERLIEIELRAASGK